MGKMIELGILLSLVDTASSPLRMFGSALEQTAQRGGNAMQRLGDHFDRMSAKMTLIGASAAALGGELTHLAEKPIHAFMEMDSAMNDLAVATLDKTGKVGAGFDALRSKVFEIDNRLPVTSAQVAEIGTALKSANVTTEQMLSGAYDAAANLAVVLRMPGEEAATMVARTREAFALAGSELPRMADEIQRARFAFGITPGEIKDANAYSAPSLNILGLTGIENANKILALQGMGAGWNFQGGSFGTNFAMFLTRLSKGPEMVEMAKKGLKGQARKAIEHAHVKFDFYDKKGQLKSVEDMVSILQIAREKLKAAGGDKMVIDVFSSMFGMEAGRVAEMLATKGTAGFQDSLKRMSDQATLDQRVAQTMQSAQNIWTVFTTNVTNALGTLGGPAVQWLEPMVMKLGDAVAETRKWSEAHQTFARWLVVSVGGVGALLTTFGALAVAGGIFAKVAGGPLRLLGGLLGKKGGTLGTIGHALEGVGVQRVFVVNMPGGGLGGIGGGLRGAGRSADELFWGGSGKKAAQALETAAKPVGRLGRVFAAVKGAPGAVLSRMPGLGLLGKIPGRGLLRKVPWLRTGMMALDVMSVASSDASAASKRAAYTGIAGGAAGSAVGGLVGGAIGSVVPVLGTAVGGFLGSMIGGWAGQKLGDWAGGKMFAQKAADHVGERVKQAMNGDGAKAAGKGPDKGVPKPADIKVEYKPQIIIQGDPLPGTAEKFEAMLRQHQATIAKMIRDITAGQQRTAFGG